MKKKDDTMSNCLPIANLKTSGLYNHQWINTHIQIVVWNEKKNVASNKSSSDSHSSTQKKKIGCVKREKATKTTTALAAKKGIHQIPEHHMWVTFSVSERNYHWASIDRQIWKQKIYCDIKYTSIFYMWSSPSKSAFLSRYLQNGRASTVKITVLCIFTVCVTVNKNDFRYSERRKRNSIIWFRETLNAKNISKMIPIEWLKGR